MDLSTIINEEDATPPSSSSGRFPSGRSLQDRLTSQTSGPGPNTVSTPVSGSSLPSRFRTSPRTDDKITTHRPVVKQTERPKEVKDLQRLRQSATSKLGNSFSLLSLDDSSSQLADTYDISMRIVEFEKTLFKFDMIDVFSLRQSSSSAKTTDLLSMFASVTEADVRSSNLFFNRYGQEYDLQNLHWSAELIENSCDQDLLDKVSERLISIPHPERGGPLSFFFAMEEITSSTTDAVRALERRVTSLKLTDFPGENVSTAVSQLRSAISRLSFLDKLPHDILHKLLDVFQSSSVPAFNDVFKFVSLQIKIDPLAAKSLTHSSLLVLASTTHRELVEKNEWSGGNAKKPALLACFKCNKDGHLAKDCPDLALETSTSSSSVPNDKGWTRTKDPNGKEHMSKHGKDWHWCSK